jgi:hypothetical protein
LLSLGRGQIAIGGHGPPAFSGHPVAHPLHSKATAWQTTKSNAKLVTALAFKSSNNHPSPPSEFIPHAAKFATVRGDLRRQLIEAHRTKDRTALVPLGTSDGITPVKNLSYDASTGAGGIFWLVDFEPGGRRLNCWRPFLIAGIFSRPLVFDFSNSIDP